MEHKGTQRIETERLILRQFTIEDSNAMYNNWASDSEVTKYLKWPAHKDEEISIMVLNDWIPHYNEKDYYQWAIVLKENGDEPIGSIGVVEKDDKIQMAPIGYCLGKRWWSKGIMTEALSALIDFFFREVGLNRIESRHDTNNPGSGKVMEKCGMKYEGCLRQGDWNNQGISDCALYAILAEDYNSSRKS